MLKFAWIVCGKLLTEQLSIMNISSQLKNKGVDSLLIYGDTKEEVLAKIENVRPDIIAYSLMYGSHWVYLELANQVKDRYPDIYQVAGGPYTTFYPKSIFELGVNAIGVGEAELSLPNLVDNFQNNRPNLMNTKGFHFRQNGNVKMNENENLLNVLDESPFPDREIFYEQDTFLKNQEFKSFLSGRGCPYPCTYCFNHKFNEMFKGKGKVLRKKSVDYFVEEVKETKDKYGCQFAIFEDDIFVMNKPWLEEFSVKFKEKVNIPYICYVRANYVTENLAKLLKSGGCHIVRMAIETGNEKIRNTILKRNMKDEDIIKASDLVHKYGMQLSVSNMMGLPSETVESVNETVDLNIRCAPDHPTSQFFMPYPGMELSKIAIEMGHFDKDKLKDIPKNTWRRTPLKFDKETKREIEKTQKLFTLIVKFPKLKKFKKVFFLLPDWFLYLLSMFVKILTVRGYLPPTKVSFIQRIRVLIRFFKFYG